MTKAQILKKEILSQYRSVRQFAMDMQIPYSTLVTALERGIDGMAYGTVIKMQLLENHVMQAYVKLNQEGRDKVMDLMEDFGQIKKYKAK